MSETASKKKYVLVLSLIILIAAAICFAAPLNASARDKTVRIGYFPYSGYQESSGGYKYGYNYEYLQQIAQDNGWKLKFVDGNYSQCLRRLKRGDIDIVGCVFKTSGREKYFDYPHYSCGNESLSLYVSKKSDIAYDDYSAMNGMRVGYLKGSSNLGKLKEFCGEHDISFTAVQSVSVKTICRDVKNGTLDAGLIGGNVSDTGIKAVAQFALEPFYFVTTKGNTEVLNGLNNAIRQIKTSDPSFETDLASKYLNSGVSQLVLTKNEQTYVAGLDHKITVVYNDKLPPVAMTNDDGSFGGISADMFALISKKSGIKFKYISMQTGEECIDYLKSHKDSIIADFCYDYNYAGQNGLDLTSPYLDSPMEIVEKEKAKSSSGDLTTAVTDLMTTYKYIKSKDENTVKTYHSTEDCLDAVKNGEADRAYVTTYSANYYLNNRKYRDLECVTVPDSSISICAAMSSSCNDTLIGIMQKSVRSISKNQRNDIIISNSLGNQQVTLAAFVDRMPVWLILMLFIVFAALVALLLGLLHTRKKASEQMKVVIQEDKLTGLYSEYGFDRKASEILKDCPSDDFTVIDMDVANIRDYNLMYGFEEGDELIKYLADHMKKVLKTDGIACRVNAAHFVMLVKNSVRNVTEGLVTKITMTVAQGKSFPVFLVYGLCGVDNKKESITLIRDNASAAKDLCRKHGNGEYVIYSKEVDEYFEKEDILMNEADSALDSGEFIAYFQPKYDVVTGEVNGAEALARWRRADGSLLMPGSFIALMEERRMITRLDMRMLENVCSTLRKMIDKGIDPVPVSTNFSRVDIFGKNFVSDISEIVDRYGLPHGLLEVELTETAFELDQDIASRVMRGVHDAGFRIALDDFGSGYSSFKMIRDINFDVIKIDKSLIDDIATNEKARFITEGIIEISKGLGMDTVAEGVETQDQMHVIRETGCDGVQGYFKSKPLSEENFLTLLKH